MSFSTRPLVPLLLLFSAFDLQTQNAGVTNTPNGASAPAPLTIDQVVDKLEEMNAVRAVALGRYKGRRFYHMEYKGFPTDLTADMTVEMTFDAPGNKQFKIVSQSGSKILIEHVFKKIMDTEQEAMKDENRNQILMTKENFNFGGLEYHPSADHCSYVMTTQPKVATKFNFKGRVWVDDKDFAICKVEATPAKSPSWWIKSTEINHVYGKVGDFWLPMQNNSTSNIRLGGHAVLSISYQDYEIVSAQRLKPLEPAGKHSAGTQ
jgi:hypothetical protein